MIAKPFDPKASDGREPSTLSYSRPAIDFPSLFAF
jgi:hypothetical protein